MAQAIQSMLQQQINTTPNRIAELSQPGKPFSILADEPSITSYTIKKITTTCSASLAYSWTTEPGREIGKVTYSLCQTEENFPFTQSLLSQDQIGATVRRAMRDETSGYAEIEPNQLDLKAKLLHALLTASNKTILRQACDDLLQELVSQSDSSIDFTKEALEHLIKETMRPTFLQHPGLVRTALENEEHNPIARTMVQTAVTAKIAELANEKNRISRIQQVITSQLVDNKDKFSKFVAEYSNLLPGETDIVQTVTLDNLESEILLSNGLQTHTIKLMSKPLTRPSSIPEQKV